MGRVASMCSAIAGSATGSARPCVTSRGTSRARSTTILPGEREELHARLADKLAGAGATAAELAPHWAAAGRATEALSASVEAAREAEAAFGLAEALAHLERALALWVAVPDSPGPRQGTHLRDAGQPRPRFPLVEAVLLGWPNRCHFTARMANRCHACAE